MPDELHQDAPSTSHARSLNVHQRWAVVIAIGAILVVTYWLRIVLLPFVIAGAIAFVATPLVHRLSRVLRLAHWVAALIVYVLLLMLLAGVGLWAAHVLVPEGRTLAHNAPTFVRELFRKFTGGNDVHILGRQWTANDLIQSAQAAGTRFIGGPADAMVGAIGMVMGGFLCLLLVLFFLISGARLCRGALWLVPPTLRPFAAAWAAELRPMLFRYILGVVVVAALASVMSWFALSLILGLPNTVLVSLAVGILETIPVVGPATSAALLGIVAINSGNVSVVIGVAIFALLMRLIIDQVVGPLILGRAVQIHPVVVIFAMLCGGVLFGVLGVLLAVPVAASTKIALRLLYNDTPESASPSS